MSKRISVLSLFIISSILLFNSCEDPNKPTRVNAMVVILGRHANANAFHESYFEEGLKKPIEDTVYGGYIGIIVSDGSPRVVEMFDYFGTEANTDRERNRQINTDSALVLDYLKDEGIRAEVPENDLLKGLQEAQKLLNVFEDRANREGKKIKNKQIVILDNGIVTTGEMNYIRHGIHRVSFRELSNEQLNEFSTGVADDLYRNRLLPELNGVNIIFIGLGDTSMPQEDLSPSTRFGLENLWIAIFKKCNAKNVDMRDYPNKNMANEYTGDDAGFPYVTPITFEQSYIDINKPIPPLYTDQVSFIANSADYLNEENAELVIRDYLDVLNYHIRTPEVKIYIVGSIARTSLERDFTTDLSERRAITVKETLVKFGMPEERLEAFGLGEFYPDREDELTNGVFNETIARKNRKVVLVPSTFTDQVREVLATKAELDRRR